MENRIIELYQELRKSTLLEAEARVFRASLINNISVNPFYDSETSSKNSIGFLYNKRHLPTIHDVIFGKRPVEAMTGIFGSLQLTTFYGDGYGGHKNIYALKNVDPIRLATSLESSAFLKGTYFNYSNFKNYIFIPAFLKINH